ncbi:MAG: PQQ-binding-like beta-propeller repeat protein [Sciscionella sp.]
MLAGAVLLLCGVLVGSTSQVAAAPGIDLFGYGDWSTWQKDLLGSRHNAAEWRITEHNVGALKEKWAFAYPKTPVPAKSQPAVVGRHIYFGSPDGKFYSLDARTGKTEWTFTMKSVDPGAGYAVSLDGPTVVGDNVYFGDSRGYLYALHRHTGTLAWAKRIDALPASIVTSSPIYFDGRIYVGVSSVQNTAPDPKNPSKPDLKFPCCTFRGHIDAVNARTGDLEWRHYTVPKPKRAGNWPSGAKRYAPSGVGVWSTPTIDPATRTLYVGTGQNYTGSAGEFDSILALDTGSGAVRWKRQMSNGDTWRAACAAPGAKPGDCPGLNDGTALDYDMSSMPTIFTAGGRTLVGIGQKSGVFHVFDAHTGQIVWQRQLAEPNPNGGGTGVQWGGSYDGRRLYVATWFGDPGTVFALDPGTGKILWKTPNPANGCTTGGAAQYPDACVLAHTPAVSSSPGVVYEGSTDGKMRAYSARTGRVLWTYDTIRDYQGVNGLPGRGSQLSGGGGAVVSHGMLYVQAGYGGYPSDKGPVLLAFSLNGT